MVQPISGEQEIATSYNSPEKVPSRRPVDLIRSNRVRSGTVLMRGVCGRGREIIPPRAAAIAGKPAGGQDARMPTVSKLIQYFAAPSNRRRRVAPIGQ